jgi:Zinc finger, C2H2 type
MPRGSPYYGEYITDGNVDYYIPGQINANSYSQSPQNQYLDGDFQQSYAPEMTPSYSHGSSSSQGTFYSQGSWVPPSYSPNTSVGSPIFSDSMSSYETDMSYSSPSSSRRGSAYPTSTEWIWSEDYGDHYMYDANGNATWSKQLSSLSIASPETIPAVSSKSQSKSSAGREKRYVCFSSGCGSSFTRAADLARHVQTRHNASPQTWDCTLKKCPRRGDRAFTREDHMVEHLRSYHHLEIPKKKRGSDSDSYRQYS